MLRRTHRRPLPARSKTFPVDVWRETMDVNVTGVFLCSQVFGGRMAKEGRGSIVNVASIYGIVAPDQRIYEYRRRSGDAFFKPASYAVSKSAILNLTRYLATYWALRGVRVNTVTFAGVFNDPRSGIPRRIYQACTARPDGTRR